MKKNTCKFCGEVAKLCESHILPKFVFKYIKKNGNGRIRLNKNLNKPMEDGIKLPWLCEKCEENFSCHETYFKNYFFDPFLNEEVSQRAYDRRMLKFSASVVWRILKFFFEEEGLKHLNFEETELCLKALKTWHDFLNGKIKHPEKFEIHLHNYNFKIKTYTNLYVSRSIHRYLKMGVGFYVHKDISGNIYVYVKIQGFVIVGYVKMSNLKDFRSSRISPNAGTIGMANNQYIGLWYFIQRESDLSLQEPKTISERQKMKANIEPAPELEEYLKSKSGKALWEDYQCFGDGLNL